MGDAACPSLPGTWVSYLGKKWRFGKMRKLPFFVLPKEFLGAQLQQLVGREGKRGEGSRNLNIRISDRRRFQDAVCNAPTNMYKYKYRYQLTKTQNIGGGAVTSLSESQTGAFFQTQFSFSSSRRNSPSPPSPPSPSHFLDTVLLLLQCTDLGQDRRSSSCQRRHDRKTNSEQ